LASWSTGNYNASPPEMGNGRECTPFKAAGVLNASPWIDGWIKLEDCNSCEDVRE